MYHRTGLQITQFTSIATNPTVPAVSGAAPRTTAPSASRPPATCGSTSRAATAARCSSTRPTPNFVYGNYFGISPYRNTDGGAASSRNSFITGGIDLERPLRLLRPGVMNQGNPNQLFLGTYRLYRTDNAKATHAGDVDWTADQPGPDRGCTGGAPNGARGCTLTRSASGGGTASTPARSTATSTSARTRSPARADLDARRQGPSRPPGQRHRRRPLERADRLRRVQRLQRRHPDPPGHVFATTDGGEHWKNISGNLPDVPVNSIRSTRAIRTPCMPAPTSAPSSPTTAASTGSLGSGLPVVSIWQLALRPGRPRPRRRDPRPRRVDDALTRPVPSLVVSKVDAGVPVGAGSKIDYTITVRTSATPTRQASRSPTRSRPTRDSQRRRRRRPQPQEGHLDGPERRRRRQIDAPLPA